MALPLERGYYGSQTPTKHVGQGAVCVWSLGSEVLRVLENELTCQTAIVAKRQKLGMIGGVGVMRDRILPTRGLRMAGVGMQSRGMRCARVLMLQHVRREKLAAVVLQNGFLRFVVPDLFDAKLVAFYGCSIGAGVARRAFADQFEADGGDARPVDALEPERFRLAEGRGDLLLAVSIRP
jgi:hypothetical protein